ncbi:MAG: hypothetical protein Q3M30_15725 [Candidatus Electrothrix sp. Rat3]|nr:hypothetical protein [Candidatus Electrothrix rattekaaiensis]
MKLADSDSRLGKKLGKLFPPDEEVNNADGNQAPTKKKSRKKYTFNPTDEPETKLEKRIKQWFTAEEKEERPYIIKENVGAPLKVLVITYYRAILFEAGLFGRLKDVSDKVWRQFVSVHLSEGTFCSALELRFFRYHDSLFFHNPYKDTSPYMEETEFKLDCWCFERLTKKEAAYIYSVLKNKQLYWQEERRKEQIQQIGSLNAKPPGGSPPKKKEEP